MGKKVLFIEDEPDQIAMIKVRLEAAGYEFTSAIDGEEGLKKAHEGKPNLILLDLRLPKMNGYEICKCLKEDPKTSHIPVIIITASGAKGAEDKCRECGADGFIRKPFESQDLLARIERLIAE